MYKRQIIHRRSYMGARRANYSDDAAHRYHHPVREQDLGIYGLYYFFCHMVLLRLFHLYFLILEVTP